MCANKITSSNIEDFKERSVDENGWLLAGYVVTVNEGVNRLPDEKVINFTLNLADESDYYSPVLMEKNNFKARFSLMMFNTGFCQPPSDNAFGTTSPSGTFIRCWPLR